VTRLLRSRFLGQFRCYPRSAGEALITGSIGCLAGLILGVSLPGPHAVVVDADGDWLTWGMAVPAELFPEALITEAWSAEWGSAAGRDSNPQPLISGSYAPGPLRLPHSARSAELPAALVPSC